MGKRIILRNMQAPGDIIVLSAAIRDLHIAHPGLFSTEISVSKGAEHVYWHNPAISQIHDAKLKRAGAQLVNMGYSAGIKRSNQDRKHFMWGFIDDMNKKLQTDVKLTEFRPALYMSEEEKATRPFPEPYWVFLSGGKKDFKTKIWDQVYWQQVIDATKDRVNWVQCGGGSPNHIMHEPKNGIYANMIAQTSCRDFLRLIYHSEGVVCVITMAMHAAAAFNKPCVVIAGGREPWWWEAYNEENRFVNMRVGNPSWVPPEGDDFVAHKFLHSIGQLECCHHHGCWKKHVVAANNNCRFPVSQNGSTIPRCKAEITPAMVVGAIDEYLDTGQARRASTGKLVVPLTTMTRPASDEQPVMDAPIAVPSDVKIEPMTYCAYGVEPPPQAITAGGEVMQFNGDISRAEALQQARKGKYDWIIWIERGATLTRTSWLAELATQLRQPAVFGRAHCRRDGRLYPYPAFFAVHKSLLKEAESFVDSFEVYDASYNELGAFVRLSTMIVQVA